MIQAFLSHSSKDKKRYVSFVAGTLGPAICAYDEWTFEEGMRPIEEILRLLNGSQIFVVFLSPDALESNWVKKELFLAFQRSQHDDRHRVFPIIIDSSITHDDERIPEWIREEYNLKLISRPTVAARRIKQRLREVSWTSHPRIKKKNEIFVGRNRLTELIEERLDDIDKEVPTCLIASGLKEIGRSSLLKHALIKSNCVRSSYSYPTIVMRREESLEDMILKLHALDFSALSYPKRLMLMSEDDRIALAANICRDVIQAREVVVIKDDGCIVNYKRKIQSWFDKIVSQVSNGGRPLFIVASKYRPDPALVRRKTHLFAVEVPELSVKERSGLFKRLLEFDNIGVAKDDHEFFSDLFYGYPNQVRFACDLISDMGVRSAKDNAYQISEYNSDQAGVVLNKYRGQQEVLDFLFLLSEFEFISLDFLYSFVKEETYASIIDDFIAACICDYVGVEKEYLRLNDTIRDYVRRNRVSLPDEYRQKLASHVENFIKSGEEEERDVSDIAYSMKESVKYGKHLKEEYLIPSYFLKSMRDLYFARQHHDRVIELADMLLSKHRSLDATVAQDVRYYLCLSLARKRDQRMLSEVQQIRGPEKSFLLGFYYRLQGRPADALRAFDQCIDDPIVSARAKREKVQVLISLEDYEQASVLAKSNYEENKRNPFHIQAYINTLVNSPRAIEMSDRVDALIHELEHVSSPLAIQMADIARAEYLAKCKHDYESAKTQIAFAESKYTESHYPLLTKAFLAARYHDVDSLKRAHDTLEKMIGKGKSKGTMLDIMVRLKAYILVLEGDLPSALAVADLGLKRSPEEARQSFLNKLRQVSEES